mgnify:CR=1 FL=1
MNKRLILLCTFVTMVFLQACGSLSIDNLPPFIAQQRAMALADQESGELASALDHWQVLLLAAPDDVQARQQTIELASKLEKKAKVAYSKGLAAIDGGQQRRAKKFFAETLAARPEHAQALAQLKKLKSLQMNKFQHDKIIKIEKTAYADNAAPPQATAPEIDERLRAHVRRINAYLTASQLFQADAQYQHATQIKSNDLVAKAQLARLSNTLADSYFQHARRLMRSDLNKAIEYLQISLRHEPDEEAEILLQRSRLIRDNLTKIQGSRRSEKNN